MNINTYKFFVFKEMSNAEGDERKEEPKNDASGKAAAEKERRETEERSLITAFQCRLHRSGDSGHSRAGAAWRWPRRLRWWLQWWLRWQLLYGSPAVAKNV